MPTQLEVPNWYFKLQLPISFKVAICDLKRVYFFLCTFAATFNRSAFNRMKPVASSWL
jgi:hypothetical protein